MLFPFFWLRSAGFPFDWVEQLTSREPADLERPTREDEAAYRRNVVESRRALTELLTDPYAVEALFLSNPESLERVAKLDGADLVRLNVRTRQRLRLAWLYLQRFCAKNETCSFFGPIAWGSVDAASPAALQLGKADPRAEWLLERRVSIEHWVVDRLCQAVNRTPSLSDVLPLRPDPRCDLDGDVLRYPLGKQVKLSADAAKFMQMALDRTSDARLHAAKPGAARLIRARVINAELSIAPGTEQPLALIQNALRPMIGCRPSATRLSHLAYQLDAMRAGFEKGDYVQRRKLLGQMIQTLSAEGVETQRPRGETYSGRFPVYEDCARNLKLSIGEPLVQVVEDAVIPVMQMFRVVAQCVAARLHSHYEEVLATLPRDADGVTDFVQFLHATRASDAEDARRAITVEMRAVLGAAWVDLAGENAEQTELEKHHLDKVASKMRDSTSGNMRFAGVLGIGIVSPDLMLAAPSVAAIREGDFRIVVGEVHPCVLNALHPAALPFLDRRPEALCHANALLAPGRILVAATSRDYQRSQVLWPVVPNLWEVVLPGGLSRCPIDRQIPAGRGRVIRDRNMIRFVDRQTSRTEDIVTVLSSDLHRVMSAVADDVLGGSVPQRLVYRNVYVKRRSWTIDACELPSASHPAESFTDYLVLRRWAIARDLPRRVFFRTDAEPKPVYVDWENPLAVDMFAKMARQAQRIRISEMSPGPQELWLTDNSRRYCSELRMSVVV